MQLPGRPPVGHARNIGCEHARGAVIAHWDDDDWSSPSRLSDQIRRLQESGGAVTGYRSMRFTDGCRWWLYSGGQQYALGTSLVYRKDFWRRNPFPPDMVGEDNAFVARARASSELVVADAADLMYATVHKGNTSPRQLKGKNWREIEPRSI